MKKHLGEIDNIFYILGIGALSAIAAAVLLYVITGFNILYVKYPCVFKNITGLYCPGCGGMRSARALCRGRLWLSFIDYPPLLYGIVVYAVFMVRCFLIRHSNILKKPYVDGWIIPYIYVGVGIMGVQWVAKLIAQIGFNYSWIR